MLEPHSSTASGLAIGTSAGILSGTYLGADIQALVIGLIASILVSAWLPAVSGRVRAASAVLLASLFAAEGALAVAIYMAPSIPGVELEHLKQLAATMIGACTPTLFPIFLSWAGRFGGTQGGDQK